MLSKGGLDSGIEVMDNAAPTGTLLRFSFQHAKLRQHELLAMKLTIVSPTLNESENVPRLVRELEQALTGIDYEIIIVDDDSPDGTWEVAQEVGRQNSRVQVIRRNGRRSLGWSVIDGFTAARGDVLACMDADLQHDPAILPRMLEQLDRGCDLVVGSRYAPGGTVGQWGRIRRFESSLATKLAQWLLGIQIYDPMSGYFLLRRADFLAVRESLNGQGFKILLEIAANLPNAHICEIPYTFRNRLAGKTKLSRRVVLAFVSQLWRLAHLKAMQAETQSPAL
jgi:dolichol-phosphate mannosyltransferase